MIKIKVKICDLISETFKEEIEHFFSFHNGYYFPEVDFDSLDGSLLEIILREIENKTGKRYNEEEIKADENFYKKIKRIASFAIGLAEREAYRKGALTKAKDNLFSLGFERIRDIEYKFFSKTDNILDWGYIFTIRGDEEDLDDLLIDLFDLSEEDVQSSNWPVKKKILSRKGIDRRMRKKFKDFFIEFFEIDVGVAQEIQSIMRRISDSYPYEFFDYKVFYEVFKEEVRYRIQENF